MKLLMHMINLLAKDLSHFMRCLPFHQPLINPKKSLKLFKDFNGIPVSIENRMGDTLPLVDIRDWFDRLALNVWTEIEKIDV